MGRKKKGRKKNGHGAGVGGGINKPLQDSRTRKVGRRGGKPTLRKDSMIIGWKNTQVYAEGSFPQNTATRGWQLPQVWNDVTKGPEPGLLLLALPFGVGREPGRRWGRGGVVRRRQVACGCGWRRGGEGNRVTQRLCASHHSTCTSPRSGGRPGGAGNSTYKEPRKTRQ